jgi:hypothetical protein
MPFLGATAFVRLDCPPWFRRHATPAERERNHLFLTEPRNEKYP